MPEVKLVAKVCHHDYVFLCFVTHALAASENPASLTYPFSLNKILTNDLV